MIQRAVHIALGANIPSSAGSPLQTIAAALAALDAEPGVRVACVSSAWETEPIGPPQPRYVNAAAELRTTLAAIDVLERSLAIERRLGRDRDSEVRWGPRAIDIDVLLDGESRIEAPGLTVPHPRLAERGFVLAPLCEIAPDLHVPNTTLTVRSLLAALPTSAREGLTRLGPIPFRSLKG